MTQAWMSWFQNESSRVCHDSKSLSSYTQAGLEFTWQQNHSYLELFSQCRYCHFECICFKTVQGLLWECKPHHSGTRLKAQLWEGWRSDLGWLLPHHMWRIASQVFVSIGMVTVQPLVLSFVLWIKGGLGQSITDNWHLAIDSTSGALVGCYNS